MGGYLDPALNGLSYVLDPANVFNTRGGAATGQGVGAPGTPSGPAGAPPIPNVKAEPPKFWNAGAVSGAYNPALAGHTPAPPPPPAWVYQQGKGPQWQTWDQDPNKGQGNYVPNTAAPGNKPPQGNRF